MSSESETHWTLSLWPTWSLPQPHYCPYFRDVQVGIEEWHAQSHTKGWRRSSDSKPGLTQSHAPPNSPGITLRRPRGCGPSAPPGTPRSPPAPAAQEAWGGSTRGLHFPYLKQTCAPAPWFPLIIWKIACLHSSSPLRSPIHQPFVMALAFVNYLVVSDFLTWLRVTPTSLHVSCMSSGSSR